MANSAAVAARYRATSLPAPALGWDPGWAAAFRRSTRPAGDPPGSWPRTATRWVVALPAGDRDAVISGPAPPRGARPRRPARRGRLGGASAPATEAATPRPGPRDPGRAPPPDRVPAQRRRGPAAGNLVAEQVLAANVDVAFVVAGLDGDFNLRRLERYLAVAWSRRRDAGRSCSTRPTSPSDLAGLRVAAEARRARRRRCAPISALTGDGVDELAAAPPGARAAPPSSWARRASASPRSSTRSSGGERQRTGAVREDDSRGRHTTTHRELVRLPGGALLIDTPGIRSLGVAGACEGLDPAFADIDGARRRCRFGDCRHEREPGCAVRAALADGRLSHERLASHRKLEKEAAHVARSGDGLLREAERKRVEGDQPGREAGTWTEKYGRER